MAVYCLQKLPLAKAFRFDGAAAAAESIVKRVSELGIPFDASPFGKVTISAGCSARGNAAASLAALIKQADKALYKAKQSGRNRAAYA